MAEELAEALLDTKFAESLAEALSPYIKPLIDDHVTSRFAELDKSIVELKKWRDTSKQETAELRKSCQTLKEENVRLYRQLDEQATRLEGLDSYSRADNLIFKGLPERTYAERASGSQNNTDHAAAPSTTSSLAVESTVIEFCREALKLDITKQDISIAHRLKASASDKCRPIIVRFTNRRARESVLRAKKSLKSVNLPNPVYISEQLTKSGDSLYYEARKRLREKKLAAAWTFNGQVFVKFSEDASEKATVVKALRDLNISK
jgi:hypothetical protein